MGTVASNLNINKLITTFATDFKPEEFKADQIFPPVSVMKDPGTFIQYDREWQRKETGAVQSLTTTFRDEAPLIDVSGSSQTYNLDLIRLRGAVDERDRRNVDGPVSAEQLVTRQVRRRILLEKESRMVDLIGTTGNYATGNRNDLSGGGKAQWDESTSTGANSPVRVVMEAKTTVMSAGGMVPNVMIVGFDVHHILLTHSEIRDRLGDSKDQSIAALMNILASVFGMEEYHVINNVRNTAQEGATDSFTALFSDKAALIKRVRQASTNDHQFGVQFQGRGFPNGDTWRDRARTNTQFIEVRDYFKFLAVSDLAGFLFIDVLT